MDSEIIRRWNERVKPYDTVIHLGDFGFFKRGVKAEHYLDQLNGNIVLVQGNHDNNNGVPSIVQSLVIKYGGIDWWCAHHPSFTYNYNLCGHVHNNWLLRKSGEKVCINVGVDVCKFYPVNIQEILREIGHKEN